ncbi:hypothetical protein [uncultured Parabacteroides sp.]|uniref:hypothetical protein n=1 Tax=uncultured Parabacteroides sp. TaxID=512312 RepID=UPI00259B8E1D|nr:hypothetical protein [uncultured Parabacteroides sp.]
MKTKTEKNNVKVPETKVFDFRKIPVLNIRDEVESIDVHEHLGNVIYNTTSDIGAADKGREMFHKGKVELTQREANYFSDLFWNSSAIAAPLKTALKEFLKF